MIDEQYYQLAAEELDTPELKSEVWDRACKLASDDKEEAQLLYINLRVEEMLGNDKGDDHAFTAEHASNDPMISSVDKFDGLEFEDPGEEFDISDQIEAAEATEYDEVLAYDAEAEAEAEAENSSFSDMSGVEVLANDDIPDFETIVDLTDAADNREYTTVMDTDITGDMLALAPTDENIVAAKPKATDTNTDAESIQEDAADALFTSPEAHKTALLAEDFERQAADMGEISLGHDDATESLADEPYSESFSDALNSEDSVSDVETLNESFDTLSSHPMPDDELTSTAIANDALKESEELTTSTELASTDPTSAYEDTNYDPLDDLLNNLSNHAYNDLEDNEISDIDHLDSTLSDPIENEDAPVKDGSGSMQEELSDTNTHAIEDAYLNTPSEDTHTIDTDMAESTSFNNEAQSLTNDANDTASTVANTDIELTQITAEDQAMVDAADHAQTVSDSSNATQNSGTEPLGAVAGEIIESEDDMTSIEADELVANNAFMVFSRDGEHKVIKQGSSLPAMLITFPWLLSKTLFGTALTYAGLWIVSLAGLITGVSLWMNASTSVALSTQLFTVAFALLAIVGLLYLPYRFGNSWVADKLQKNGFEFKQSVDADSKRDVLDELQNQAG